MSYYIPNKFYNSFASIYSNQTPPTPVESDPFTVKVLNAGTTVRLYYSGGEPQDNSFFYKKDGGEWTAYIPNTDIEVNDTISFSGTTSNLTKSSSDYYKWFISDDYIVSGHLDSLVNGSNLIPSYSFYGFFADPSSDNVVNTNLIDASDLIMPSGSFGNHVFERMFFKCANLTASPQLPAKVLSGESYRSMFDSCSSLVRTGAISAETIDWASMQWMFANCTSLTTLPYFNPKSVGSYSCKEMFRNCHGFTELNIQWDQISSVNSQSFASAFCNCSSLVSVSGSIGTSDMIFNGNEAFLGIFQNNKALVDASHFTMNPMNITRSTSYSRFFRDDSALLSGCNLPATGFTNDLIYNTFYMNCTNLVHVPPLHATAPYKQLYNSMFRYCNNLNEIEVAFKSWYANGQTFTDNWVQNVAAAGTFIKPYELPEEYGSSRIPNGWTVKNVISDYNIIPMTFEAINDDMIFQFNTSYGLEYKIDNGSWTSYNGGDTIQVNEGSTIAFSGNNDSGWMVGRVSFWGSDENKNGRMKVYGNIMSLLTSDFANITDLGFLWPQDRIFQQLFENCENLVDASNLILPSCDLSNCQAMFYRCFAGCTNLVGAPVFPATSIPDQYIWQGFAQCYSLTGIVLSGTTLTYQCYHGMLYDCTSLEDVTVGFTDWNNGDSTQQWLTNTPPASFHCPASLDNTIRDDSHIPNGWYIWHLS